LREKELAADVLLAKASRALRSARLLLETGDFDGAANRAYYAMFSAARAALLATNASIDPNVTRTHSGLIGAFGLHLVKNDIVPKDIGRMLNRAHETRLIADYNGEAVERPDAELLVEQAAVFLDTLRETCLQNKG
jgi:uncharacterized protein (UPF0332 family)